MDLVGECLLERIWGLFSDWFDVRAEIWGFYSIDWFEVRAPIVFELGSVSQPRGCAEIIIKLMDLSVVGCLEYVFEAWPGSDIT